MALTSYFQKLIDRVEGSGEITNQGTDEAGFFKPTKTVLLRHLNLLKDLHNKPLAKDMFKASWAYVAENLPPEWLVLNDVEKTELKKILS